MRSNKIIQQHITNHVIKNGNIFVEKLRCGDRYVPQSKKIEDK